MTEAQSSEVIEIGVGLSDAEKLTYAIDRAFRGVSIFSIGLISCSGTFCEEEGVFKMLQGHSR